MTQYIQAAGGNQTGHPWLGSPITCNLCGQADPDCFVDGQVLPSPATQFSGWALMCIPCFKQHGKGIGQGLGQKYCKKE